jgi:large subunit ribosomal protein L25
MEAKLEAERRDDNGKGVARKLRAAGRVPAVFYGHGQETVPLSVDAREMFHLLHTAGGSNVLLDLVVDGKPHLVRSATPASYMIDSNGIKKTTSFKGPGCP